MPIASARKFIKRGIEDRELRRRLNGASDLSDVQRILADESLRFSADEFEEAFRHLLTECQSQEAADQVREFRAWWEFLAQTFQG